MEFRDLQANEIECRVAQVFKDKGVTLLLYKNARVDAAILDETVGKDNWQDRYYEVKGNLYCSVGINTNYEKQRESEDGIAIPDRWIWKDDCGSESNVEKAKGEASDAFKRACATKWGIGVALYTAPFIWIKADNIKKWDTNRSGNPTVYDEFRVKHIMFVDGKIEQLIIFNETTKKDCFEYGF